MRKENAMAEKDANTHPWLMERRYFFWVIVLVFVILSAVAFFLCYRHHTINTEQILKEDRSAVNLLSLVLDEHLKKLVSVMESYVQRPLLLQAVRDKNAEKALTHLINLKKSNPDVDILIITDRQGTLWTAYPERPESLGVNFAYRDWYKGVSKEWKSNISDVVLRVVEEKDLAIQISVPFVNEKGEVIGILTNTQRAVGLNRLIKQVLLDTGAFITVSDRKGQIVSGSQNDVEKEIKPYPFHSDMKKAMTAKRKTFVVDDPSLSGRTRYISFAPVVSSGWTVSVERDKRSIFLSEIAFYIQVTAIAFFLFLSIVLFLVYSRKQVTAQKIQEQLQAEITLRQSEESARLTRDYLDKLIGYANAPIIVWDPQFIITRFNHAFEDLTGLKAEEVLGREIDLLFPGERRAECLGHIRQTTGGDRWEVIEIPILHRDGSVRTVLWNSATIFSPDGKTAIATIAQGQDITDRKRIQEENERRARQLTVLHETSVELTAELNLDALLHSIAHRALNLIGGASCNCYLHNLQTDLLERVVSAGTALIPSPKTRQRGEGMVGQVWVAGTPLLINDYASWSGRTRAYDSFPSRALVAVPLRSGTEILGVINIMASLPHQYTQMDVEMMDLFAAQAAIAIRNARLHEQMKMELAERRRAEEQIDRQSKLLAAINSVFYETLTADSEGTVAMTCLKVAQEITESKFGFIGEITPEGLFTTTALSDPGWEACRIPETQANVLIKDMVIRGIWGQVILKEQSLIVNNPASYPDRVGIPEDHPPLTSFLGVPLKDQGKVIGMIAMGNRASGYTADQQQDMETLSVAFVEAIRRKKAEEEIKKLNTELEQRVIDRTAQLSASNKELEAFSYSVSHDLRAPLRSIDGFSQALLEEYQGKLDDTGKNFLKRVRKATQRMGLLIDDMLKLSRITQAEMKRGAVDLSGMIREIGEAHQKSNPNRTAGVTVQEGIVIQGDPYLMKIAMENLVDNAFKFTGKESNPRIEFGTTVRDGETTCFIRDNGAGFDMAYVDKLFGAFQRLHTTDEFPGTGIGLATVQRIIHRHGGRVWAEGEQGKGATFSFTLPS
jgi:PAS domain S-box-containing protein